MAPSVYSLRMPDTRTSCAVFNSPHSGADYPDAFLRGTRLGPLQIRSSEDAFVDRLFGAAPACGAPLLAASVPRAYVDLNRAPDDFDPALISDTSRRFLNARIAAGLGVIPRVVAEGRAIIDGKLPLAEAERRIATYWRPYHDRLRTLLNEQRARFGMGVLLDCHSMPRDALACAPMIWGRRPDVVLGDRFGTSCDRWLIDAATDLFTEAGFVVARNVPFAGGYITQSYGRPRQGIHTLQIEIDRGVYMDERRIEPLEDFDRILAMLGPVVAGLAALGPKSLQVAAE